MAKQPPPAPQPVFTFADLARLYEAFAKGKKKTWRDDVAKAKRYLIPAWGRLPLRDVTRARVHELLDTLVAKGMSTGVNRVQAVISRMFTVALDRSLIDAHPATRMIKRFEERPSDRVLTDDELRMLWTGLDARPGRAADALRLRLLLGQRGRRSTACSGARSTSRRRRGICLERAPRTAGRTRCHCPLRLSPSWSVVVAKCRPTSRACFPASTRAPATTGRCQPSRPRTFEWKDLRRTFSTRLAARGFSEQVVGRALNHARHTVTARHYIKHPYLAEVRQALEAWDRELAAIIAGEDAKTTSVLQFRSE